MPPVLAKWGRMSISLHPDTTQRRTLPAPPVAGAAAVGGTGRDWNPHPAVHQIRRLVRRGGRRCAAVKRDFRGFLLLSRTQGGPDPHSARTGGRGRRQDHPVHQGNRKPAWLDHPIALVRRLDPGPPLRCVEAVAAGAGDHRIGAGRFHRQGAAAGVAARHGRGRTAASTFPRIRNSPKPSPTRSITGRSISAANPNPT